MRRKALLLALILLSVPLGAQTTDPVVEQIDIAMQALVKAKAMLTAPAAPYITLADRSIRPKPALPVLGPAGFTFTDPTFGNKILRVTDGAATSSWRVPSNAHLAAWSADSKRFFVVGQAGVRVFNFDATLFKAGLYATPYSQGEPSWSRSNADWLYTVGGSTTRTIRRWSASTNTFTDVLDLDTVVAGLGTPRTYVGGLVAAGTPDAVVAFFGGQGQDDHRYVVRIVGTTWRLFDSVSRLNTRLHSVSVDLSGRYVFLYPTNAQPYHVAIWDTMTDSLTPVTNAMWPFGHDAQGFGMWINQDVSSGTYDAYQWNVRPITNLTTPKILIDPVLSPPLIYGEDHTNWNNAQPNQLLPVFSGVFRYPIQWTTAPPAAEGYWRAWDDEVIAIATTGPSTVYRFAHHRSDVRDETGPKNPDGSSTRPYFWYEPIVNVDPSGKFLLFTSNWEKTLGADVADAPHFREDVFLVALK